MDIIVSGYIANHVVFFQIFRCSLWFSELSISDSEKKDNGLIYTTTDTSALLCLGLFFHYPLGATMKELLEFDQGGKAKLTQRRRC